MKKIILSSAVIFSILILLTGCNENTASLTANTSSEEIASPQNEASKPKYKATQEITASSPYDNKIQFGDACVTFPTKISTLINLGAVIETDNKPSETIPSDGSPSVTEDKQCILEFKGQKLVLHIKNANDNPISDAKDYTVIGIDILDLNPDCPIFLPGGISLAASAEEVKNVLGEPTESKQDDESNRYSYIYEKNNTYFDLTLDKETNKLVFIKGVYLDDETIPVEKRVNTYIENNSSEVLFCSVAYTVPESFSEALSYEDSKIMKFDNHEYRCMVSFNDFVYPKQSYTTGDGLMENMKDELSNTQIVKLSDTDKSIIVGKVIKKSGGYIVHTYVFCKETGYAFSSASYSVFPINENETVSEKAYNEFTKYAVDIINTYSISEQ